MGDQPESAMDGDKTIGRNNSSPRRQIMPPMTLVGGIDGAPSSFSDDGPLSPSTAVPVNAAATIDGQQAQTQQHSQWPTNADQYELVNRIGQGAFASVWKARRRRNDHAAGNDNDEGEAPTCAVKIMDLEHVNINISDIRLEVQTMRLSSHANVLVCYTSFIRDTHLWLVTQLMSKGSSLHCLQSARAKILNDGNVGNAGTAVNASSVANVTDAILEGGFNSLASRIPRVESLLFENHITYILYETLLGLSYIHENGQIHRDVKAGNILLDGNGDVRIADFGVSSWLINGGSKREHARTFVGTPCWMAPEVMEQVDGYDYKADIWSLGITALELAKGYAPYAKHAPMKVLLLTIQEDSPTLETYVDGDDANMWSKSFRSMIKLCLQKDPEKRPTCHDLMAHRHFRALSTDAGKESWRRRIKEELCDIVEDVGLEGGNSAAGSLPGQAPVQIVTTTEKDRPAGTSWIFSDGSQVVAASASSSKIGGEGDFFDQFEEETTGEHFNRDATKACVTEAGDGGANATKENPKDGGDEEEDINDFFDEFEKTTGGENFRREN